MAKRLVVLAAIAAIGYGAYYFFSRPPSSLVLTGIVTTHDVEVSPQIGGRLVSLSVQEGESVRKGPPIAEIDPGELEAERAFYQHSAAGIESQVEEGEAALRLQERQVAGPGEQAGAGAAAAAGGRAPARDVDRAKFTLDRTRELFKQQLSPAQAMDEARSSYESAQAKMD